VYSARAVMSIVTMNIIIAHATYLLTYYISYFTSTAVHITSDEVNILWLILGQFHHFARTRGALR